MEIRITLPTDAERAMRSGARWSGTCQLECSPATSFFDAETKVVLEGRLGGATSAAKADAGAVRRRRTFAPDEADLILLDTWNDSEFIRLHAAGESRNNPLSRSDLPDHLPTFRKARKDIGMEKLMKWMELYFESCMRREHLWDGKNHGYSHVGGFLRACLDSAKTSRRPWWRKTKESSPYADPQAALTAALADAYAQRFLGRPAFGLRNPSKEYKGFMDAAALVKAAAARSRAWGEADLVRHLIDCAEAHWGLGGPPAVGALSSDTTWKVNLPAWLKKLLS